MAQLKLKYLKMYKWSPVRDINTGQLVGIKFNTHGTIKLKYLGKEAKEYVFCLHPLKLSSLEKELL